MPDDDPVHRTHGELRPLGDLLDGGVLEPLLAEHLLGGVEQVLPVDLEHLLPALLARADGDGHRGRSRGAIATRRCSFF